MAEQRPHGSVRPGGRTARTRAAVLRAALDELDAERLAELTVEKLAERSGVHAATIRRRWRTVEGVVCDLLENEATTIQVPDTGDLRQDLHDLARGIVAYYSVLRNRNLMAGIVAAAAREPRAEEVLREFFDRRISAVAAELVQRAVDRGELPADTDAEEVVAAVGAPVYYRLLVSRRPLDDRLAHMTAEAVYHAARSGSFRRLPSPPAAP